jgi:hypothetical protein
MVRIISIVCLVITGAVLAGCHADASIDPKGQTSIISAR